MARMKRFWPLLLLLLLAVSIAGAVEYPQPKGFVNDFAGVMQPDTVQQLEAVLTDLRNKTGVEEAVVSVKSMDGLDVNTYAVELFKKWGIGSKKNNDGVLLLYAQEERKVRIEVGYGLEGLITDARSGMILDQYVIPAFRQNDFNTGLYQGALAIAQLVAKDRGVTLSAEAPQAPPVRPARSGRPSTGCGLPPLTLIIIVLIALFLLTGGRGGCCVLPGCLPGCLLGSLLGGGHRRGPFDQFGGMGGMGGFGGGFGGGSGGGFGGFGGGFSGGGGASRGF